MSDEQKELICTGLSDILGVDYENVKKPVSYTHLEADALDGLCELITSDFDE